MRETFDIINLGLKDYQETYKVQKALVKERFEGKIPDTLILVEHPPVFTIGRSSTKDNIFASSEELKEEGIRVYKVDRGGDITYHGPGQIVGYPIIDLREYGKDVYLYLRTLEEVLIKLLKDFSIEAGRIEGMTGVWVHPVRDGSPSSNRTSRRYLGIASNGVNNKKIASIGIGISKWVTYHGFCLNIAPNMRHFDMINPCGLGKPVTSIKELLNGKLPSRKEIENKLVAAFIRIFSKSKVSIV